MVPDQQGSSLVPSGHTRERLAALDCGTTSIGLPERWPECLRCVLEVLLSARVPMLIAWGSDQSLLYNDACAELLGGSVRALGRPARELPAGWDGLRSRFDAVVRGGTSASFDGLAVVTSAGTELWLSGSAQPLTDASGDTRGVSCLLSEVSAEP